MLEDTMNTIWSTYVQKIGTLYDTRSLRFSDIYKDKYLETFKIEDRSNLKLLEIGCGPGALAESLRRWYPNISIYAIDRDSNFINYASKKSSSIYFSEGDATRLKFDNNSLDVTISNTVAEHIEPSKFYGEQYRVLKKNGVCLVLSARNGINIYSQCVIEQSEIEKQIWERVENYFYDIEKKYDICLYQQNESEIPLNMEKNGFKNVSTEYITINLTPDNPIYSRETAYAMINANRQVNIDNIDGLSYIAPNIVDESEIEELKRLVNKKYDYRLALYDKGIKLWDTNVSVTMIIRGVK